MGGTFVLLLKACNGTGVLPPSELLDSAFSSFSPSCQQTTACYVHSPKFFWLSQYHNVRLLERYKPIYLLN